MLSTLIKNANIVNEGKIFRGHVVIKGEFIDAIYPDGQLPETLCPAVTYDAQGKYLIPGAIDDQVHFRQPGLTHKGDINSESAAAVAGGITSFMEMPNTNPQTVTQGLLESKCEDASRFSLANYSFYLGATNDNLQEIKKIDPRNVCGVKVFLGSSTGNMLVDDPYTLEGIFKESPVTVAIHSEDEKIIQQNLAKFRTLYNNDIPFDKHGLVRNAEACYASTAKAVEMAAKFGTRLHVLHLSTAREMELFSNSKSITEKLITAEVCVHHLWFNDSDYQSKGPWIKWNPAIKTEDDRQALWRALLDNRIDVIATDHAPHTIAEKSKKYLECPSGGPLVQHALPAMLDFVKKGTITLENVVEKMCHAPARLFRIEKRGFIRTGYYADLVLVDSQTPFTVTKENILYKCGWSPFEGHTFSSSVTHTFVNGKLVYDNNLVDCRYRGKRLSFER